MDSMKQQQKTIIEDLALVKKFILKLNQLWNLGAVSPYVSDDITGLPVFKRTEIRYKDFIKAIPKVMFFTSLLIILCTVL